MLNPLQTVQLRSQAAHITDFETVAALFAELHHYNASLDERFALADNWRESLHEHFLRTWHASSSLWLLAWRGETPVGLLILEQHQDSPLFRHHSWIELVALYVRASQRGTGVAQHLMEQARDWAASQGADRMQLYVTAANARARTFYQRCGWKLVQEIWRLEWPSL